VRRLDEARRHARDLIPALRDLLVEQGWKAGPHRRTDIPVRPDGQECPSYGGFNAVVVSRGPGSYTGLRVGLMTAKTLAYAIRCTLLGIDTFAAIARQAPEQAGCVDVLADAQQGKVYVQGFFRVSGTDPPGWRPRSDLAIKPFAAWLEELETDVWVSGPGVRAYEEKLRHRSLVDASRREPLPESLLHLGLERLRLGECDDFWTLEPLYLRPSAAEEKWASRSIT